MQQVVAVKGIVRAHNFVIIADLSKHFWQGLELSLFWYHSGFVKVPTF